MTQSTDDMIFRDAAGQIDYAHYRRIASRERAKQMHQLFSGWAKAFHRFWNGSPEHSPGELSKGRWA